MTIYNSRRGAPETGAALLGVTGPTILHIPEEGKQLTMEFSPDYPQHVLWNQGGKPFLCVEPINGTADGLNKGIYLTLNPGETKAPQENVVPQPTVVIVQQADAEYEKWLAATMVMCVSMEYPDFELEAIYAASATALENKFDSQGAYIVFTAGGSRICIHSKALEAERTAPGTKDISSETIGYATFDQLDPNSVDFSSFEKIDLEDLTELFVQSLLVSIYAR